jgi:hypothetical protein
MKSQSFLHTCHEAWPIVWKKPNLPAQFATLLGVALKLECTNVSLIKKLTLLQNNM